MHLQNFAGDFWPGCIEQFTIFETKFEGATNLRILENRPEHKKILIGNKWKVP